MRKRIVFSFFTTLIAFCVYSQEKVTLSGTVSDNSSNETIIGASVSIDSNKSVVYTNEYGFYSITLPIGTYTIKVYSLDYGTIEESIALEADTKKNFSLSLEENTLQEVVVKSSSEKTNLHNTEMSVNKLNVATIKKMPAVLGEVDIIKSIIMLPGVTNTGEGSSGFNVRGGAVDQNLILLDEASIYSSSHLMGFFSVFNPDAIKDMKLYKGGIPAQFGGRASSVLDIYQKNGNSKEYHVNGGIGVLTSRLLVEGPTVKDKGSFLVGGRISYLHLFLKLNPETKDNSLYFYDLNMKLTHKLGEKDNLYISGYFGRDVFAFKDVAGVSYGNATFNGRWNHLFSDKLFTNLSLIYSDYYFGMKMKDEGFNWDSGIKNFNFKYDFKHYLSDKIKLDYGLNSIYYVFNPGTISTLKENTGVGLSQIEKKNAFENALYVNVNQEVSSKLLFNYGLRYSMFHRLGESNINVYEDNNPVIYNSALGIYESATPIDVKPYGKNKVVESFNYLEPRAAICYQIDEKQSVKANYNRMAQYIQLISNTSTPTPLDIWLPSDTYIKPQIADQVALGYFRNLKNGEYSVEVESYYKTIKNRLDYIDGANLIANDKIETVLLNGEMRSYGLEFMLRKNTGKLNGWIAYTLSKSQQRTPGRTPEEVGINNGEWYTAASDKTHDLSVTGVYNLNKKWSFGSNFVIQSGRPSTFPNGRYDYLGMSVPSYNLRNTDRLPAYHHLDISATLTPLKNQGRKWKGEWVFSIYNIYNQKNAASISFGQNKDTGANEATKLSIFGIVPGVSYNFKF